VEVDSVVETAATAAVVETAAVAVDVAATTATKTAILLVNAPSNVPKVAAKVVATTTAIRQDRKATRDSQK
jgi:hypothetical protein